MTKQESYELTNPVFNGTNADKINSCKAGSSLEAANIFYDKLKNMVKDTEKVLLFSVKGGGRDETAHYTGVTKGDKNYCKKYTSGKPITRVTKSLDTNKKLKKGGYYFTPYIPSDLHYHNYSIMYDPFVYDWAPYATYLFDHHLWLYNSYFPFAPFNNSLVPQSKKNGSK